MPENTCDHPSDEALRALSMGELAEAELAEVAAHLADCPACCHRIDQLAIDDRLLARLKQDAASQEKGLVSPAQRRSAVRALRQSQQGDSDRRERAPEHRPVILPAPRQIGDYEILSEVGRGGMGVVYKAWHRRLHRLAALKMVLAGEFMSASQELRFRLEAELAARVLHPNIVQVYEIGSYEGRPFLALEWVERGSLASRLDGKPWPPDEAASFIETLARAIDLAHSEGVVHRDLKPANILLAVKGEGWRVAGGGWRVDGERLKAEGRNQTRRQQEDCEGDPHQPGDSPAADRARRTDRAEPGDTSCGPDRVPPQDSLRTPHSSVKARQTGSHHSPSTLQPPRAAFHRPPFTLQPKITDFGLARTIEGGQTMTQSGFLVGTPGYMAPEQASGKRAIIGPATDIHALGVILYQLLTGELPFKSDSTLELLRAVASDEPTRVRRLQPDVPRDLEAITLHCLEKEPGHRYPSALALAEDLRRFREGQQVAARPAGSVARLTRACRRRPLVAVLAILLAVSLFGGLGGVTSKWLEADEQRNLANAHAKQADTEKRAAQYQAYRARLAAASGALENHDVADAARHLESAPEALRGWEWHHLRSRLDDSSSVIPLPAGRGGFLINAPGRLGIGVSTGADLRVSDLEGSEHRTLPIFRESKGQINVTQTQRGLRVAAWVDNEGIRVLDNTGRVLCRVAAPAKTYPTAFVVSPDGTRLACAWADGPRRVEVFDATSGNQTAICDGHGDVIWCLSFSPDGTRLASGAGSDDPTVRLWDAETGKAVAICQGHTAKLHSIAFAPDGARLVTTASDRTVRQWDARTGQEIEPAYDRHASEAYSAVYSPDREWVASAGADRTIRVWRARGRKDVTVLHGHAGRVVDLAFAPCGRRLASVSCQSTWVAVGDNTVRVWDVHPQATLPMLRGHTRGLYPVAYSPDGRWLASGGWDNTVRLWDAATGEPCARLPHSSVVTDLTFGPDGTWLMTATGEDHRLRVWDVATAGIRQEIPFPGRSRGTVTVSPDGTRVAATMFDPKSNKQSLIVCDIASSKPLFSTEGAALAYSPDGRWLAALDSDEKTVLLLDASTHARIARFRGHEDTVFKAAFSHDGRRLASCSRDRTVRLWPLPGDAWRVAVEESSSRSALQPPPSAVLCGHTDEVFAVAFHPDGRRLATSGRDGAISLWDLKREEEVVRLPWHKSFVWSLAFSPNGATLASGSGDCTAGLWDTVPVKARYQARREAEALRPEAERLVDQLWRENNNPAQVVEALRSDRVPSQALRHAALRAVQRRTLQSNASPVDTHARP